jgi:hypothetical protein
MLRFACLVFFSWSLSAAAATVPPGHWGKNLVPNPGFEIDANGDGEPDGWSLPPKQWAWDAEVKHAGVHSLRFTNTDKNVYRLIVAKVALIPGVAYHVSAMVRGENVRDGSAFSQGAGVCLEYSNAKGQWMGGSYPECRTGTFDWTRVGGDTPPVPKGAASGTVVLYLRKHNTGTAWFDDVEVKAIRGPVLDVRIVHTYRATVTTPTEERLLHIDVRVNRREYSLPDEPTATVSVITADKAVARLETTTVLDDGERLCCQLPALPLGKHELVVRLTDGQNKPLGETKATLRVTEPIERRVTLDGMGRLVVEGKPFFPLGLYLGPTEDEHLARIAAGGFNTILCYGYGQGRNPRAYLDRAHKHGLKVIYSIKDLYEGSKYYRAQKGLSDIDAMRKYILDFRDHPTLIAWYTNDELPPSFRPKLQAAYDLVCELDPHHPAFQVLCRPGEFDRYYDVLDIFGCDPYPVPNHPVTMVGDWMDTARAAMAYAKPVWCVPQIFAWSNYTHDPKGREPTFAEKRAMAYLALIHGAQGLVCYSYYDLFKGVGKGGTAPPEVFERRWREVSAIAQDVRKVIPALLGAESARSELRASVRWRSVLYNGRTVVLAVNTDAKAEARFNPPVPAGATLRRLDGALSNRLGPQEAAIYVAE